MFANSFRRAAAILLSILVVCAGLTATTVASPPRGAAASTDTTTLRGVVTNRAGTPLANMTVHASPNAGGRAHLTRTAANGTYTLSGIPIGQYSVSAYDDNARVLAGETTYAGAYWNGTTSTPTYTEVTLTPGTFTANFALPLKTGIVAKAVDAVTGAPLENMAWQGQILNETTGRWDNLARDTPSTYETGKTFWNTFLGKQHRFCFVDTIYRDDWRPTHRYQTACWRGATSFATATSLSPAFEQTVNIVIPMTKAGLSLHLAGMIVHGDPAVGGRLTAEPGTWSPEPVALSYQWFRRDVTSIPIPGATGASYTPTEADRGHYVDVQVTGRKSGHVTHTIERSAGMVGVKTPTVASFTVTGARSIGSVLTAAPGATTPASVNRDYTWYADGVQIPNQFGNTYTITSETFGKVIGVSLRTYAYPNDGTWKNERYSFAYVQGILTGATPTISGAPRVGSPLTANAGTWTPAPVTLSYQWRRNGVAISGATASTYTPTSTDAGATLAVAVTGHKDRYTTRTAVSAGVVAQSTTTVTSGSPTLLADRLPQVKSAFTVMPGTWGPAPVTLTYQWFRGSTAIAGATGDSYIARPEDVGHQLRARVTGTKPGFASSTAYTPFSTRVGLGGQVPPPPSDT